MIRLCMAMLVISGFALAAGAEDLPADVRSFLARRAECDHFRGEDSEDPARRAEIDKALERTCRGSDAALRALKGKYRNGPPPVMRALDAVEQSIE